MTLCCLFSSLLRCLDDCLHRDVYFTSKRDSENMSALFPATAAGLWRDDSEECLRETFGLLAKPQRCVTE